MAMNGDVEGLFDRDGEGLFGDGVEGLFDEGRTGILHADTSRNEIERIGAVINPQPRQRWGAFQRCCRTRWRCLIMSHSSRLVLGEGRRAYGPWLPWS